MKLGWALLVLCGFLPVGPVWGQAETPQLLGSWQLRLWVTGPAAESAGPREASGPIELRRTSTGPVPRGLQWVYNVTYDSTLYSMLGAPRAGPAQAVLTRPDSVKLAFNPFVDHGAFRLTGVARGDSIIGTWHRTGFADDGYRGSFTMVRRVAGQRRDATLPIPPEFRRLEELGELRLKRFSIHGYAPLVVLFTEAPASASEVERRYRHRLTTLLMWSIERLGVSLLSLNPTRHSSAGEILRGMTAADRAQVFVGFADGAVAAARVLLRDSLSAALVALAPGTPGNTRTQDQEVVWQELLRPVDHPRDVLVLESMCNGPTSALAEARFRKRQTVLMLPQYDGWLSRRMSSACPANPAQAAGMDDEVISIVTDWLKRTVIFPQ